MHIFNTKGSKLPPFVNDIHKKINHFDKYRVASLIQLLLGATSCKISSILLLYKRSTFSNLP